MTEPNGQSSNESRLDRLELVRERMIRDHEEFRAMHQRLHAAQLMWQHQHLELEQSLRRLSERMERIGMKGELHG